MSNSFQTTGNDDLDAVIAAFLQALERGDAPDRDDLIKEQPQFEEELRAFFADLDGLPNVEGEEATEEFAAGNDSSRVIGNYELVQKIGSGGMGEVWVAKQSKPVKRRVALKLIKAGMDSKQVVSRFEAERQALAAIDHPNVAKVLDAGTTPSGQPYFVMELVNGAPLTKFCDEAKLGIRERLELMVQIANAVQHAHHKGIVHRDLKPANILVTVIDGKPVPKIIDFGLAKALGGRLTDESFATHFGSVMGTLEYMAPEQAGYSGQDVDTRADIYSLGVILYELLTGLLPFDSSRLRQAALDEMLRIIREEEPARPSLRFSSSESAPSYAAVRRSEPKQLAGLLRSELDWIVMKSLDKDRNRRYETASSFSQDINRYLIGDTVQAHPPTLAYRLRKFARRNKEIAAAMTAILVVFLLGAGGTLYGLWKAQDEARKAKAAEQIAEAKSIEALASLRESQLNLNRSVLRQSNLHWTNGDPSEAIRTLNRIPTNARSIEWQLANLLYTGGFKQLDYVEAPIVDVAGAKDCDRVACVWENGQVAVVDGNGKLLNRYRLEKKPTAIGLSADGESLALGGDNWLKVYDSLSNQLISSYECESTVTALSLNTPTNVFSGHRDGFLRWWSVGKS
ncbi:MAG: protein kinase [Planctomycetales bacterium]|nr:protein kinase [Planctomycetales bacterium]